MTTATTSVGRRLREARESRHLTIHDVATVTMISARALTAIEAEAFSRLPEGIYRRAYVRAFASAVGLDPDELGRNYVAVFEPLPPATELPPSWSDRQARIAAAVLVAVAVLAAAGLAMQVDWAPGEPAPAAAPAATPGPLAPGTNGSRSDPVALELVFSEPSWVRAVADGRRVVHRVARPGDTLRIEAASAITVEVADAGAVVYSLNGVEPRVLGSPGETVTLHLTPEDAAPHLVPGASTDLAEEGM